MLRPSGAHLHRILQHVLRAVHTVVTPVRFAEHERTEIAVSGDDLRQTKREDAVATLLPLLKEGLTVVKKILKNLGFMSSNVWFSDF